jgi:hypothetical protein
LITDNDFISRIHFGPSLLLRHPWRAARDFHCEPLPGHRRRYLHANPDGIAGFNRRERSE